MAAGDVPQGPARGPSFWRDRPAARVAAVAAIAVVVVWLASTWLRAFTHSIVRDAFVDSHLVNVAPQVHGEIIEMSVQEQDRVSRGQVLARLDPRAYRRARDVRAARRRAAEEAHRRSEAELAVLEGEVPRRIEIATLALDVATDGERSAEHAVEAARADATMAREDYDRFTALARSGSSTTRRAQEATRAWKSATAGLGAAEQRLAAARKERLEAERRLALARLGDLELEAARRRVAEAAGRAEEALRALELAELELAYTEIVAPFDGVVAKKWRHRGDYAAVGEPLFSLYDPALLWVTANVPETLLDGVAPGNEVELDVVAWEEPFRGRVLWVGSATDAKFSLIPRDVSAGEFTWVVQRVPVRIWIERDERWPLLRPGLSVVAAIEHGEGDPEWAAQALREEARIEGLHRGVPTTAEGDGGAARPPAAAPEARTDPP